jgi:hypothetical protein
LADADNRNRPPWFIRPTPGVDDVQRSHRGRERCREAIH